MWPDYTARCVPVSVNIRPRGSHNSAAVSLCLDVAPTCWNVTCDAIDAKLLNWDFVSVAANFLS